MLDTCDMMPFTSRPASGDMMANCNMDGPHDAIRFEAVCKAGCGKKQEREARCAGA